MILVKFVRDLSELLSLAPFHDSFERRHTDLEFASQTHVYEAASTVAGRSRFCVYLGFLLRCELTRAAGTAHGITFRLELCWLVRSRGLQPYILSNNCE